jgi:hypothetical protein
LRECKGGNHTIGNPAFTAKNTGVSKNWDACRDYEFHGFENRASRYGTWRKTLTTWNILLRGL